MPNDIELRDFAEGEAALRALALALRDLRPFWALVVPLFVGWMREQFETEGAFGGAPWAPPSPAYLAWKSTHHPGKGILVATGDLRRAASLPKREATPTSLTFVIENPVAGYHQEGTDRMPARPLIFDALPALADAELEQAAERYITETVHRLGLPTGGAR